MLVEKSTLFVIASVVLFTIYCLIVFLIKKARRLKLFRIAIENGVNADVRNIFDQLAVASAKLNDREYKSLFKCFGSIYAKSLTESLQDSSILIATRLSFLNNFLSYYPRTFISPFVCLKFAEELQNDSNSRLLDLQTLHTIINRFANNPEESNEHDYRNVRDLYIVVFNKVINKKLEDISFKDTESFLSIFNNFFYISKENEILAENIRQKAKEVLYLRVTSLEIELLKEKKVS
jgi:hypothetical protein